MPNLKGFHAQPSGSMVCGAYALTAILDVFNLLPASKTTILKYGNRKSAIYQGTSGLTVARNIYAITGCGPGGNNLPAAMSYVATEFGLKPTVGFMKGCPLLSHPLFGALFKNEQSACQTLGAGGKEGVFSPAAANVCQAICVDNGGGWIPLAGAWRKRVVHGSWRWQVAQLGFSRNYLVYACWFVDFAG
ncbi:MAG: hypothetical protein JMN24_05985 [gamma proteobacterium endosymbiont of Lamellibrachia anaximandri]|nr:hypothetical protein [gamma proteobacterium endosymbiont of Lamellibrachia anaximandri]